MNRLFVMLMHEHAYMHDVIEESQPRHWESFKIQEVEP